MMSLKEAFEKAPPNMYQKKTQCLVGELVKSHEDGAVIERVIADNAWSAPQISRALVNNDIKVSASTVRNHRKGDCACYGRGN